MWEVSWRLNRTATYWPPLLWPKQRFFPVLLGCSTGGLGPSLSGTCSSFQHLLTNWLNFLWTDLYNNLTPSLLPASVQFRTQFHPSTVKGISWYSSTWCTSYLHRCISYFDSLAKVSMLQIYRKFKTKYISYIYTLLLLVAEFQVCWVW